MCGWVHSRSGWVHSRCGLGGRAPRTGEAGASLLEVRSLAAALRGALATARISRSCAGEHRGTGASDRAPAAMCACRCVHAGVCRGPPACRRVCTMCARCACARGVRMPVHPCGSSAARLPCSSYLHGIGFLGRRFGLCNGLGLFCGRPLGGTFLQRRLGLDPGLGWRWERASEVRRASGVERRAGVCGRGAGGGGGPVVVMALVVVQEGRV